MTCKQWTDENFGLYKYVRILKMQYSGTPRTALTKSRS